MSDITISYKGSSIATMDATGSKTLLTEGKYCEDDITVAYTKPSGGSSSFELVDTIVVQNVSEWTSTSAIDTIDTQVSVTGWTGVHLIAVITCDSVISSSTEWGMSFCGIGRNTNGNVTTSGGFQQKGTATLDFSALSANVTSTSAYGAWIAHNVSTIRLQRKCYSSTSFQKVRGGTYTIKIYKLSSL